VVTDRIDGQVTLRVRGYDGSEHAVDFGEAVYAAGLGDNREFTPDRVRLGFSSLTTPGTVFDYVVAERRLITRKVQEIPSGYDPSLYVGRRLWATAPDGPHYLLIPVDRKQRFVEQLAQLDEEKRVNWQRHVIQRGETLSQIARRYHTSIDIIKESNGLHSNFIRTGHSLLIPSAKMPPRHYSLSLDSRRYRGLKRIGGDGEKYLYTVRKGDTLWDIGRQYGVSITQLSRWNGISPRRYLKPGQKLTLWISREQSQTRVARAEHGVDESGIISYTVQRGDSLWLISRRFGVTIRQLVKWNNLRRENHLQPGQRLILKEAPALASGV